MHMTVFKQELNFYHSVAGLILSSSFAGGSSRNLSREKICRPRRCARGFQVSVAQALGCYEGIITFGLQLHCGCPFPDICLSLPLYFRLLITLLSFTLKPFLLSYSFPSLSSLIYIA